jgi:RHS repeat-associated protein
MHLLKKSTSPLGIIGEYTYDSKGNLLSTQTRDGLSTAVVKSETAYTTDQNYVLTQKDARGKTVSIQTDPQKGTTQSVTDPTGQTVNYAYDELRRVTSTQTVTDGKTYQNTYAYGGDQLTQVKHNTTDNASGDVAYTFAYDDAKRPTQVKVGNQTLSSTAYNADGTVQSAAYGNGGSVDYTYDAFKRVTGVKIDGGAQERYTYAYNANGQVAHVTDNRLNRVAQSEYDLSNRPMRIKTHENGSHVYTGEVGYDVFGNLMEFTEKVGPGYTRYVTSFGYDEENRPTTLTYGDVNNKLTQAYDGIGRVGTRTVTVGGRAYNTSYTYESGGYGAASTTPLINSITQDGQATTYTYDDAGNILSVDTPFHPVQVEDLTGKLYEDGGKRLYAKDENGLERILYAIEGKGQAQTTVSKVSYAYDKLGQLTRVDDPYDLSSGQQGTTTTYSYDLGGNILEKRVFPYTQPSELPIGTVKVVPYTYTDANWKDKLTSYNGTTITYDAIGNPLSDGTWTYAWESGRQLATMTKTGTTVTYSYNVNGLRTMKTVIRRMEDNSLITETSDYTLHGKQVVHLKKDGNNLHFFYDAQGKPSIVDFNNVKYGYVHNLQGDITAIVDGNGNTVVEYTYDAWGKELSKTGTLATTLGTLNPFRYRGYVFDEETGLYYLRNRYYNPVWGRFVNADVLLGEINQLLSHNIYSYCRNNPICSFDPTGKEVIDDAWSASGGNPSLFLAYLAYIAALSALGSIVGSISGSQERTRTKDESDNRIIYRYGDYSYQNLTPNPTKKRPDTDGLSFSLVPPKSGIYCMTTIAAVNATGVLRAEQNGETHVKVYPVDFSQMSGWLASWRWADIEPHPYTVILANIVYTPGEELAD